MMLRGGNAKEIVGRVKEKVAEINERGLFREASRSCRFMTGPIWWTRRWDGVVDSDRRHFCLMVVILFIFLGNLRTSLVVCCDACHYAADDLYGDEPQDAGEPDVARRVDYCHRV